MGKSKRNKKNKKHPSPLKRESQESLNSPSQGEGTLEASASTAGPSQKSWAEEVSDMETDSQAAALARDESQPARKPDQASWVTWLADLTLTGKPG